MLQPIKIILPSFFTKYSEIIYFKGHIRTNRQEDVVIYVTIHSTSEMLLNEDRNTDNNIVHGYCSRNPLKKPKLKNLKNCLVLEHSHYLKIVTLILDGKKVGSISNCLIMLYDYDRMKHSEVLSDSTDYFFSLKTLLKEESHVQWKEYDPICFNSYVLSSSKFAQHLQNYLNLFIWLISSIKRDKKISIRLGNIVLAILTDILLGYLAISLLTQYKKYLLTNLMGMLEHLVNLLYNILKWIMGAPAGLKLNNAFNKMLGKYFTYHIQLWWLFLEVSTEKLDIILDIYHCLGYFGFTFQAAIISDVICIATFHSYCIYVYAARLFNMQISGITALLRLFVGRKYNPLRGGIDSCEYTNQELFVGTVAVTILLLLLPTTTMYYIVFTLLRLLSILVQFTLAKTIYVIQTLPLYTVTLWLMHSPKVAGNTVLEVQQSEEGSPLVLNVKLLNKSLQELISKFVPPVQAPKELHLANILSNICVGNTDIY